MKIAILAFFLIGFVLLESDVIGDGPVYTNVYQSLEVLIQSTPDGSAVGRSYKNVGENMLKEISDERRYSMLLEMADHSLSVRMPFVLFGYYRHTGSPFSFSGILITESREVSVFLAGPLNVVESEPQRVFDMQTLFSSGKKRLVYVPEKIAIDPPGVSFVVSFDGEASTFQLYYDPNYAVYSLLNPNIDKIDISTLMAARFCFSAILTRAKGFPDVFRLNALGGEQVVKMLMEKFYEDFTQLGK